MNKSISCFLFLHLVLCGSSQIDIEKIISQDRSIPPNWIDLITKEGTWKVINTISIGNKNRKVFTEQDVTNLENSITVTYKFLSGFLTKTPMLIDTFKTLPVTYFPNENTFYVSYTLNTGDRSIIQKFPFKIIYLDSAFMGLEHLELTHFNFETGKILSDEELAKKMSQQPIGKYDVVYKSKKKGKSQEGLRIVELLSIKIN